MTPEKTVTANNILTTGRFDEEKQIGRRHFYADKNSEGEDTGIFMVDPNTVSQAFLDEMVRIEDPVPFSTVDPAIDLARRTGLIAPHRAIIALRDPANADRAKISIQVAFTKGLASNLQDLLAVTDMSIDGPPTMPDSATFYSVTKWDAHDRATDAGKFVIDVAVFLKRKYPHLEHMGTLSPIKSLRGWLLERDLDGKSREIGQLLRDRLGIDLSQLQSELTKAKSFDAIKDKPNVIEALRVLGALCVGTVYYDETKERYRSHDVVANFHMANGAMPWDILTGADTSPTGWKHAFGCMANHRYPRDLERMMENRAGFSAGRPNISQTVRDLIDVGPAIPPANRRWKTHLASATL